MFWSKKSNKISNHHSSFAGSPDSRPLIPDPLKMSHPLSSREIKVVAVNVSERKGTIKKQVERVVLDGSGVVGDAHAGPWHRQVSLLGQNSIDRFAKQLNRPIQPGEFAENITLDFLDHAQVAPLDRFRFGEIDLEVTQIGKECHGAGCAIFQEVGKCVMPQEGIFTRVRRGGTLVPGDRGVFEPRPFQIHIITLSDRAAAGLYEDRSGPKIKELLQAWLADKRWHGEIETKIIPDHARRLNDELTAAKEAGVDLLFTTGGTGVGPRDITPETVAAVCEKIIPGIMENIRMQFGATKPNALLSRSIAGTMGTTQIYTLPGSVRAVEEYMGEILKTVEHLFYMLHGLDVHR